MKCTVDKIIEELNQINAQLDEITTTTTDKQIDTNTKNTITYKMPTTEEIEKVLSNGHYISFAQLHKLATFITLGIQPDDNFTDDEHLVWQFLNEFINRHKNNS